MPRQARLKSSTGIYHIMLRGINQQMIFEEDEDSYKFLSILKDYKEICGYKLLAYCLMGNHIHLLIKEGKYEIQSIMKRIGGKYVYWYNPKYQRIGHLFQDRYKSEPVEDDAYLLTVLRYIHQNPVKANLVLSASDYIFSSYNEYFTEQEFVDTDFILSIADIKTLAELHNTLNEDNCIDVNEVKFRVTDEKAKMIIQKITKCDSISEFQCLSKEKRDKMLIKLKEHGLSIRQINRLTGISRGIIEKA